MKVYVDGVQLAEPGETLGAALESARAQAGDRLIVEVTADGRPVPADHLDAPPGDAPYASEVHLTTADGAAMARYTMDEMATTLRASGPRHAEAAERLQQGDTVAAMELMGGLLDTWRQVAQTVGLVRQLDAETGASIASDEAIERLNGQLGALRQALMSEDWSGLADVLAYDMPGLVEEWSGLLSHGAQGSDGLQH